MARQLQLFSIYYHIKFKYTSVVHTARQIVTDSVTSTSLQASFEYKFASLVCLPSFDTCTFCNNCNCSPRYCHKYQYQQLIKQASWSAIYGYMIRLKLHYDVWNYGQLHTWYFDCSTLSAYVSELSLRIQTHTFHSSSLKSSSGLVFFASQLSFIPAYHHIYIVECPGCIYKLPSLRLVLLQACCSAWPAMMTSSSVWCSTSLVKSTHIASASCAQEAILLWCTPRAEVHRVNSRGSQHTQV